MGNILGEKIENNCGVWWRFDVGQNTWKGREGGNKQINGNVDQNDFFALHFSIKYLLMEIPTLNAIV